MRSLAAARVRGVPKQRQSGDGRSVDAAGALAFDRRGRERPNGRDDIRRREFDGGCAHHGGDGEQSAARGRRTFGVAGLRSGVRIVVAVRGAVRMLMRM